MKKSSAVPEVLYAILAIVIGILIIHLGAQQVIVPSMTGHGIKQAHVVAQFAATTIDALARADAIGQIDEVLPGESAWDISISGNKITVSHENFKNSATFLGDVSDIALKDVKRISVIKRPGEAVKVEGEQV